MKKMMLVGLFALSSLISSAYAKNCSVDNGQRVCIGDVVYLPSSYKKVRIELFNRVGSYGDNFSGTILEGLNKGQKTSFDIEDVYSREGCILDVCVGYKAKIVNDGTEDVYDIIGLRKANNRFLIKKGNDISFTSTGHLQVVSRGTPADSWSHQTGANRDTRIFTATASIQDTSRKSQLNLFCEAFSDDVFVYINLNEAAWRLADYTQNLENEVLGVILKTTGKESVDVLTGNWEVRDGQVIIKTDVVSEEILTALSMGNTLSLSVVGVGETEQTFEILNVEYSLKGSSTSIASIRNSCIDQ